jgi:prepilin-type N-terminal cleavage/methylation domain-containing protein
MLKNKKKFKNSRGFTFIEVLIVVVIIGLLASVITASLLIARNRARDASFKSTAKSIQTALVSCCLNSGAQLGSTPGGLMCVGGNNYPDAMSIGTISAGNCTANYFLKIVTPGTKNKGNCTQATITTDNIEYIGC